MAKKQATKRTLNKSSSAGKKQNILSFLNPNSPKKQFLMFIAIFAIIGGGVMVYRSYAAIGYGIYTADQMQVTRASAYRTTDSGAKNGTSILVMARGSEAKLNSAYEPIIWAQGVRACANVGIYNGGGGTVTVSTTIGGATVSSTNSSISSVAYKKVCTAFTTHTNPNAKVGVKVNSSAGGNLKVNSVAIEYDTGGGGGK